MICKVSLDISENRELGATYNIRAIPAVILFSNGKEVKRLVGLNPEETYRICVDKMIEKTDED